MDTIVVFSSAAPEASRVAALLRRHFPDVGIEIRAPEALVGGPPRSPDIRGIVCEGFWPPDSAGIAAPSEDAAQPGPFWLAIAPAAAVPETSRPPDAVLRPDFADAELVAAVRMLLRYARSALELRRMDAALQKEQRSAEAASKVKNEFLAHMSHEIRTPMNAIIGITELLMSTPLSEDQRDYVETIRSGGEMLLAVINDILDFTKIEAGRMELERRPFSVSEWLDFAVGMVRVTAERKGLELRVRVREGTPDRLVGDPLRMRQILGNLLSNAVKFTERGGVTVSVSAVHLKERRCLLRVAVQDTGIGIPPDRRDRLFQAFSQLDSSTTRRFGGTGLGLAICRKLVELMGGTIGVESEPGKGAIFRFTAPMEIESETEGAEERLAGRRAIIVGADTPERRLIVSLLGEWGIAVDAIASAEEARPHLVSENIHDVALVDISAGGDAKFAAVRELRRARAPEELPIIVYATTAESGISAAEADAIPHGMGVFGWLSHPARPDDLKEILLRVVKRAAPAPPPKAENIVPPQRVLVVEDNPINLKVALRMLERLGMKADVAEHGGQALERLTASDYELVFMDVQMPVLDGFETTRRIREEWPADRQPWIVAMTAHAMRGDREKCLSQRMDDYISKPLRELDLRRALARFRRVSKRET